MPRRIRKREQMGFGDNVVDDAQLSDLLEERERLASPAASYRGKTKAARERVKELGPEGDFRCGRFTITIRQKDSRTVQFEQGDRTEINFKVAK